MENLLESCPCISLISPPLKICNVTELILQYGITVGNSFDEKFDGVFTSPSKIKTIQFLFVIFLTHAPSKVFHRSPLFNFFFKSPTSTSASNDRTKQEITTRLNTSNINYQHKIKNIQDHN